MRTSASCVLCLCLLAPLLAEAVTAKAGVKAATRFSVSPVRRIVDMLVIMEAKVEDEGKKTDELFEQFLCGCKADNEKLGGSVEDAEEKIPQLISDIKGSKEMESGLQKDLVNHKADRAEAESAVAKATDIRKREAGAFAKESGEAKSNVEAFGKAIAAVEKGMGGAFLQTGGANRLRAVFSADADLSSADRDLLSNFLQGRDSEPASGEIVGIMKQMKETMSKELAEMTKEEEGAVAEFNGLLASNNKIIASATKAIEAKTARVGETAVAIVNLEEDLDDTTKGLAENKAMLVKLNEECDARKKDHQVVVKTRQEELIAIADTIKLLNEGAFLQVLPSAEAFIQISDSADEVRGQAVQVLRSTLRRQGAAAPRDYRVSMLVLAIKGKKVGFEKVLTMLDEMVALLKTEQTDDDKKKEYCEIEIDKIDDEIKTLKGHIGDIDAAIEENKEGMETVMADIKVLSDGIVDLDRSIAAATAQRKQEHAECMKVVQQNNAAEQLVEKAKARMQKFYGGGAAALTQTQTQTQTFEGYSKKKAEAGGVLAMMDMMKADLVKETQELEFEEKDSQGEYETMVKEAAEKRSTDKKAVQSKEATKAGLEESLLKLQKEHKSRSEESFEAQKYLADLTADCQFLMDNYDTRKEARANEIDAMNKAKAVLSGADYSLVQTSVHRHLRRAGQPEPSNTITR